MLDARAWTVQLKGRTRVHVTLAVFLIVLQHRSGRRNPTERTTKLHIYTWDEPSSFSCRNRLPAGPIKISHCRHTHPHLFPRDPAPRVPTRMRPSRYRTMLTQRPFRIMWILPLLNINTPKFTAKIFRCGYPGTDAVENATGPFSRLVPAPCARHVECDTAELAS